MRFVSLVRREISSLATERLEASGRTIGGDETDVAALYDLYLERTSIGQGDVHAFINDAQPENKLVFDLYRGLTDQLDVIVVVVSASRDQAAPLKSLLRQAFDLASCQIHYEEGHLLQALTEMINVKGYPRIIKESGYRQQLLFTRKRSSLQVD